MLTGIDTENKPFYYSLNGSQHLIYKNKDYTFVAKVLIGYKVPIPKVGDVFIPVERHINLEIGEPYTLRECTCFNGGWPYEEKCGPHLFKNGNYTGLILGRFHETGYYSNGNLYTPTKTINNISCNINIANKCNCGGPSKSVPLGLSGNCEMIQVCTVCKKEK